jgi:hypothetical protein
VYFPGNKNSKLSNETATKAHKWSYAALDKFSGLVLRQRCPAFLVKEEHCIPTRRESDQKGAAEKTQAFASEHCSTNA